MKPIKAWIGIYGGPYKEWQTDEYDKPGRRHCRLVVFTNEREARRRFPEKKWDDSTPSKKRRGK